jgi:hypothetical protein
VFPAADHKIEGFQTSVACHISEVDHANPPLFHKTDEVFTGELSGRLSQMPDKGMGMKIVRSIYSSHNLY